MAKREVCGPNCSYRGLYEGSQTSLSDMASRHAQALGRVGRLRSAMVSMLRRNFGSLSNQAETKLGTRLSEVDDEVLLAYVDAFVASSTSNNQSYALSGLKEALQTLGVPVSSDDPVAWIEKIHQLRQSGWALTQTVTSPPPAADPEPTPVARPLEELAQEAHESADSYWGWEPTEGDDLSALFADQAADPGAPPSNAASADPSAAEPASAASSADVNASGDHDPARTVDGQPAAASDAAGDADGGASGRLDELFADAPRLWDGDLGEQTESGEQPPRWQPSPVRARDTPDDQPAPAPSVPPEEPKPTSAETASVFQPPLRPELVQAPKKSAAKGRRVRTQATPAEELDVPVSTASSQTGAVDASTHQALLAAASIPRPVFTRDLVAVAGSSDAVEAWEDACRADPGSVPVRFIAPKARHRMRGRLVIVNQPEEDSSNWWQQCVAAYRASRLYELGVLLNRVGDEVVSYTLADTGVLLRLNTPRGLVGVAVTFTTDLEAGSDAYRELQGHLEQLLSDRLTLTAVLTTSGESGSLDGLVTVVSAMAAEQNWAPAMPVVAARSWEYADDRGSSAVLVLGS